AFSGVRRFEDFQRSLGIARNVLAARLGRLVDEGVLERVPYQSRPERFEYRLTEKGLGLWPVIVGLLRWGDEHYPTPDGVPGILATMPQPRLSSAASVQTQTSVVLSPARTAGEGGSGIWRMSSALRSSSPRSPCGPPSTWPSSPSTSPTALATAIAATVSPPGSRVAAYPTPLSVARSRPSTLPTAAPAPAPTRPRAGTPPAAASQAA